MLANCQRFYAFVFRVDNYSPKHLADRFTQLFEKEWKSAYLESTAKNKDEIIASLLYIVMVCIFVSTSLKTVLVLIPFI